ncbi:hypothetical protein J4E91_010680 [Alternaria rosae]|nr:hypothetical protein J4E91_010680 [Alternaria rosae]
MASCWAANGRQSPFDGNTHVPCNMTAVEEGGHSTCCPIGDLCLTNGMCLNVEDRDKKNWYWRTACTDKEWKDPACPLYCEEIEPDRNTGLVFNCLKPDSWCCAYVGVEGLKDWSSRADINTTCCAIADLNFSAEGPIVYATATNPIQVSIQSTSIATTSAHLSAISQATSGGTATGTDDLPPEVSTGRPSGAPSQDESSSGLSTGAKIGLGVGVPVGVLGILAIGACLWMRRRKRATKAKNVPELYAHTDNKSTAPPYQETAMNQQGAAVYRHEAPSPHIAAELPAQIEPHELPQQTRPA